jgi:hypothetical protein
MNRRLVKKKRPAKASHKAGRSQTVRKASSRSAASRKTASRQAASKSSAARTSKLSASKVSAKAAASKASAAKASAATKKSAPAKLAGTARVPALPPISALVKLPVEDQIVSAEVTAISVTEVTAVSQPVRAHKFRVGQTVSYTSSPISRPGASGSYQVVRLLPSDGDDYQYRIKNPGEAFERVAKESQLELDH